MTDITQHESDLKLSANALEQRARRAARRVGLRAKKSRRRGGTIDNRGDFMLLDPHRNFVVACLRFDLSAEDVIEYLLGPGMRGAAVEFAP